MKPVNVGVVGCGAISAAYFTHAAKLPILNMMAVADLNRDAAEARGKEFGIKRVLSVDELLSDPNIELVLNLTVPKAHAPVATRAILAGKHTFSEKPLAVNRAEGMALLELSRSKGVLVGCAPDTFLGSGIQTARKLIDDGAIGTATGFLSMWLSRGHEHWHPNPEFYYEVGGGPMMDMGPYYLTALLQLLGPVKAYTGLPSVTQPTRPITHKDKAGVPMHKFGKVMPVHTADHVMGLIQFANGCNGMIATSFATRAAKVDGKHPIQIFGTKGSLLVPDPNGFDGVVKICRFGDGPDEFVDVEPSHPVGYGRSIGLADLAHAARTGGRPRASIEQAMMVLDLMDGFIDPKLAWRTPAVEYVRPAALPPGAAFGTF